MYVVELNKNGWARQQAPFALKPSAFPDTPFQDVNMGLNPLFSTSVLLLFSL